MITVRYNVKEVGVCRNNKHETFWTIDDKEDELPLVILVSRDSAERLCEYLESQDHKTKRLVEELR